MLNNALFCEQLKTNSSDRLPATWNGTSSSDFSGLCYDFDLTVVNNAKIKVFIKGRRSTSIDFDVEPGVIRMQQQSDEVDDCVKLCFLLILVSPPAAVG